MLIPSIDLLEGKVVQLVQGERKALEFESWEPWVERFRAYPIVQLIDLDAAMRTRFRDNRQIVEKIANLLPCQVGGGIRNIQQAKALIDAGAKRVIVGSSLFKDGAVDLELARVLRDALGEERLVFAVDSKAGQVVVSGWKAATGLTTPEAVQALEPYCGAFLYTHVDTEGTLSGFPIEVARQLQSTTYRKLIVAGGICSESEIETLDAMGMDTVVGMAIYTGLIANQT